ncbi:MAG: hypothetical protein HKN26_06915, partial [Acidimicrobiales bacterium]|nr:hypothetical protein [Acidimicrobiales bacterium]
MVFRRLLRRGGLSASPGERTAAAIEQADAYLWPYWLERQRRPSSNAYRPADGSGRVINTTGRNAVALGTVGSGVAALVDPRGLIDTGAGWSLDWWIGAEDRWHVPAREVNVRQGRIGSGPQVETSMRIPGGDAVHRCWAVEGRGDDPASVVVEFENRTGAAVALALAVRPAGVLGVGRIDQVCVDGRRITVDGRGVVDVARPPGAVAVGGADSDPFLVVTAGDAGAASGAVDHHDPHGLASAALVVPLPHHATLRAVVSATTTDTAQTELGALPDADQVAAGWLAHADAGPVLSFPEDGVAAAFAAAANRVLVALGDRDERGDNADAAAFGRVAHAASRLGRSVIPDLVPRWTHRPLGRDEAWSGLALCRDALAASAEHQVVGDDVVVEVDVVEDLLPFIVDAVMHDPALTSVDRAPLTAMLARLGQPEPPATAAPASPVSRDEPDHSIDVSRSADAARRDLGKADIHDRLRWLLQAGGDLAAWPDVLDTELGRGCGGQPDSAVAAAAIVELLLSVAAVEDTAALALLPEFPDSWYGQSVDVSNLVTTVGRLSFAVRWHGPRPALLWEFEPWPGTQDPTVLTCPALAPGWSTTERSGEVLFEVPVDAPEPLADPV